MDMCHLFYRGNKYLLFLSIWLAPLTISAQFKSATIGIDGLTCSMCSFGVQRSIEKLKFISTVTVDLNSNVATIEFKEGSTVAMNDLVKSVRDAGFSVRSLTAKFNLTKTVSPNESFFLFDNSVYYLLNTVSNVQKGSIDLTFVDKNFTDSRSYKKYKQTVEKRSDSITKQSFYFVLI